MGTAYFSDELYQVARRACEEAEFHPPKALVALVFAAMSVEAFLNDMADMASHYQCEEEKIRLFALLLASLERGKAGIRQKMEAAHLVLTGTKLDKGRSPYQDFDLLLDMRNALAHRKPERWDWPPPGGNRGYELHKYVKRLAERRVIPPPLPEEPRLWQIAICDPGVARWSCEVAEQMRSFLVDLLPPGRLKGALPSWTTSPVEMPEW